MLQGIRAAITAFSYCQPILPDKSAQYVRVSETFFLPGILGFPPSLIVLSRGRANLDEPLGALTLLNPLASACTVPKGSGEVALHKQQ